MATQATAVQTDPVCGTQLEPNCTTASSEYAGKRHHFCGRGCKAEFDENPDGFLGSGPMKGLVVDGRCGRQG
jgi:YHS domain-containing protein